MSCQAFVLHAADIPLYVIENNKIKLETCIQNARDDCVTTLCTQSSDTNCSYDCESKAKNKCLGRGQYDLCIQKATDQCIQVICVNSTDTNCPDNCVKHAFYKCKESKEEKQN
jgi:hypothetical protein